MNGWVDANEDEALRLDGLAGGGQCGWIGIIALWLNNIRWMCQLSCSCRHVLPLTDAADAPPGGRR